jgi:hypothetical protein
MKTTIQIQNQKHLRCEIAMSEKEVCEIITRRTTAGVSPTVANKSQSRPCEKKIKISEFENTTTSGNCYRRT